jgi:osmotically-inducible protein OsmY
MNRALTFFAIAGIGAGLAYFLQTRQQRAVRGRTGARGYYEGEPVADDVLQERVRSSLSGVAPSEAIEMRVNQGTVVLRGVLPRLQRDRVLAAVLAVPGVTQVSNYLEAERPPEEAVQGL